MGSNVLGMSSSDENIRIYGHCARINYNRRGYSYDNHEVKDQIDIMKDVNGNNAVSMAYISLNTEDTTLKFDKGVLGETVYLWILTPDSESDGLSSIAMKLNGQTLELDENGILPDMSGKIQTSGDEIVVPAQSYGFFVFTSTTVDVCS